MSKAESMDIYLSAFSLIIIIVKDVAYPTAMTTFICAFNKWKLTFVVKALLHVQLTFSTSAAAGYSRSRGFVQMKSLDAFNESF